MWLRYCKRAAAYNIDLAQHYYVEWLNEARTRDFTGYDADAWTRLNTPNRPYERRLLKAMMTSMTTEQISSADAACQGLVETRERFGAYYVQDDPMRDPTPSAPLRCERLLSSNFNDHEGAGLGLRTP
jgi:hypothetical protein